jgi:hypothetical protein
MFRHRKRRVAVRWASPFFCALTLLFLSAPGLHAAAPALTGSGAAIQPLAAAQPIAIAGLGAVAPDGFSKNCLAQLGQTPFDAFRNIKSCAQAWTEYNTNTCDDISPGSYEITSQPKHGTISVGIITGHLGSGACPGKTFPFKIAYYTWTDQGTNDTQDSFTIVWTTPDGEFSFTFPMVAVLAPRISGPNVVWWFKGEKPAGYRTEITLTAAPANMSYQWAISAGGSEVKLGDETANTATVTGLKGSDAEKDVGITVTVNGSTSNPFKLTVKQPKELIHLSDVDQADPTWHYVSFIHYKIFDQFGKVLPANIPLNEHWTSGVTTDYRGMNWRRGDNGGATVGASDWVDQIQGETAGHAPPPLGPGNGAVKVYHWNGEWSIGSADPSGGKGVRVQTNTWQKFQDHARHTNVVSPAAGRTP